MTEQSPPGIIQETSGVPAIMSGAQRSLMYSLMSWRMTDDLPAAVISQMPNLNQCVDALLKPADSKAVMVLTDRLFAQLPMPTKAGMELWRLEMERYPFDLLDAAVTEVIRTHRWETPPKIAQLVSALKSDWDERNGWKNKLKIAAFKIRITKPSDRPKKEDGELVRVTPAQLAELRKRFPNAFPPAADFDEIERQESLRKAGHETGEGDHVG